VRSVDKVALRQASIPVLLFSSVSYPSISALFSRLCPGASKIGLFFPRCSHTWERAPISEHRADYSVS
jgi:hypothetical protein